MPLFLVFVIILPLVGVAGTLGLSLVPRLRPYARYVALGAVVPTAVLVLILRWRGAVDEVPTLWQPSSLFGVTPVLQNDVAMQPLAFALPLAACVTVLMTLTRAREPRSQLLLVLLALLSASFVALWSANPLTMVIGWAIYDLVLTAGHIAAGGWGRTAIRGLVFGGLATLLLWGGTLLSDGEGGSSLWSLMTPTDAQVALWVAAGVLRLWVYPFHLSAPDAFGDAPSLAMFLLSPVLGWGLCLRLVLVNGGSFPGIAWVPTLAALTMGLGGILVWSCKSPRAMLPWVSMEMTGSVLLAAALTGEDGAVVISAGCVVWALGMTVLFLTDGLQQKAPWWSIPALVGALAVLGIPLTLGFAFQAALLGGIVRAGCLWWGAAFFFGNLFLVASLARWLLTPSLSTLPDRASAENTPDSENPPDSGNPRWRLVVYGVGLGAPAALLIVAGFYPALLVAGVPAPALGALFVRPGLAGWLIWVISLAVGGVLAWQEENVRGRIGILLDAVHDLLRLEWLYDALVGAMDRGLSVLRAADEVIGGAGALLWSALLFLLILMIWGGR
jgi:formate hydrogenlyase subunit 3/multisubunit Na+/H+ antiporter MnhD subunit